MALNLQDPPEEEPVPRSREEGLHAALRSAIETLRIVYTELRNAHRALADEYKRGVNDGRKIEQRAKRRRKPSGIGETAQAIGFLVATGVAVACTFECHEEDPMDLESVAGPTRSAYFEQVIIGCPVENASRVI